MDALLEEFSRRQTEGEMHDTLYIGGGTPSSLPIRLLEKLLTRIGPHVKEDAEITMECNPDDVTPELAQWIGGQRINRVSMGAQTFDDTRLKWLHRRHTSEQVERAVTLLRENGIENISIDLMFGFPGETIEQWNMDITHALALKPEHLSAYSLMYEEGTPLYRMLERGDITEIDEEVSLMMYDTLVDRLTETGYEHYEISNFALPGRRSRHNSNYWRQVPYLGLGAAAHSYNGKQRSWNIEDVKEYIRLTNSGESTSEGEEIDQQTRYNDIITTALRTREGIDLDMLSAPHRQYIMEQAIPHIQRKRLALTANRLHLTRQGIYVSDDIMSDLILVNNE